MDYELLQKQMVEAVKKAAEIIPKSVKDSEIIDKDGKSNYATEYDVAVQKALTGYLKDICPEATVFGEEDTGGENFYTQKVFIIDPIDGTTNFIHDMRMSSISVAYAENGESKAGVVYSPYTDEMFTAVSGKGAKLNGQPINTSTRTLEQAIVFFGASPYYQDLISSTMKLTEAFLRRCQDIRRIGSAALEICYVACGRAELQFEMVLCPWDYAAASLILLEAGGRATDMQGGKLPLDRKSSVLFTNGLVYEEAMKIIKANI